MSRRGQVRICNADDYMSDVHIFHDFNSEASVGVRRSMAALSLVVASETTFGGERVRKHVLDASRTSDARTPKTGLR